jgi:hypothetical protein
MPQGFGWFAKHWQPRISLAGQMPAPLQGIDYEAVDEADESLVGEPEDTDSAAHELPFMDFGFFNGASSGLMFPYLAGNELVETLHLTPEGELSFRLPGETPRIGLDAGEGVWEAPVVLHTVMIRMEDREVDLVWRAATAYASQAWLDGVRRFTVLVK